ncbi:ribonuclease III [Candidatus Pelagibacter sp.]|nr:ribonuclease III [Candidatus Pelagibacter sp.]
MEIDKIEKKLKVKFKNKDLLIQSITHKSYDRINNNEKLEFLGDRVLGFVIAKKLLELYPDEKEGILDKKLASLVNKNKCSEVCEFLQLNKIIKTNNFSKKNNIIENKIISDTCEALIGAIYLDQGIKVAEKIVLNLWSDELKNSVVTKIDAKTRLQEYSLKKFKTLPVYKLIDAKGPHHKPTFKIQVKIKKCKPEYGFGSSKKIAEQDAANILIKKIDNI